MDDLIRCPYDNNHLMKKTKYHGHLIKCMKQHPELAICVYNAGHRMSKKDMEAHIDICDSKHRLKSTKPWANQDSKPWTGGCMTVDTSREVKVVSNECWD